MVDMQKQAEQAAKLFESLGIDDPVFQEAQQRFEKANKIDSARKERLRGSMAHIAATADGKLLREELERQIVTDVYDDNDRRMVYLAGQVNAFRYLLSLMTKE